MPQLGEQHVHVLWGEVRQPQHRPVVVDEAVGSEVVLGEPTAERVIAVQAPPGIYEKFGGSAENDPQPARVALKAVVDYPKDLLVVAVARRGVGELVEIDHLVEANDHNGESCKAHEPAEQLERVVKVRVIDDCPYAKGVAGICLRCELATQPPDSIRLQVVVSGAIRPPVAS